MCVCVRLMPAALLHFAAAWQQSLSAPFHANILRHKHPCHPSGCINCTNCIMWPGRGALHSGSLYVPRRGAGRGVSWGFDP